MTVGGAVGVALMPVATPGAWAQSAKDVPPGQKPTEAPAAFVSIAPDGTTTVLCNRMDMGQGIETALAMICAEELDADWSKCVTGFGNRTPNYVDPTMGMHLTGGSNSVKNSYHAVPRTRRAHERDAGRRGGAQVGRAGIDARGEQRRRSAAVAGARATASCSKPR